MKAEEGDWKQTHQAPEESEERSKDEIRHECQVSWALEKTFVLFLLYLPHRRETWSPADA